MNEYSLEPVHLPDFLSIHLFCFGWSSGVSLHQLLCEQFLVVLLSFLVVWPGLAWRCEVVRHIEERDRSTSNSSHPLLKPGAMQVWNRVWILWSLSGNVVLQEFSLWFLIWFLGWTEVPESAASTNSFKVFFASRTWRALRNTQNWVVVSNIVYFHPCSGTRSNLTNIFQRGWNHQLEKAPFVEKCLSSLQNICNLDSSQKPWAAVTFRCMGPKILSGGFLSCDHRFLVRFLFWTQNKFSLKATLWFVAVAIKID